MKKHSRLIGILLLLLSLCACAAAKEVKTGEKKVITDRQFVTVEIINGEPGHEEGVTYSFQLNGDALENLSIPDVSKNRYNCTSTSSGNTTTWVCDGLTILEFDSSTKEVKSQYKMFVD